MPPPAEPRESRKEKPMRSWGWKVAVRFSSMEGTAAWKGSMLNLVLSL